MRLEHFRLEQYLSKYRAIDRYSFTASDCESYSQEELIHMMHPQTKHLWDTVHLGFPDPQGHLLLRHEIAQIYPSLKEENVLTCSGSEEGIFLTIQALVNPDDHIIVVSPCSQALSTLAHSLEANITHVQLYQKEKWELKAKSIVNAITSKTRLIILNFPHNPTGASLSLSTLQSIVKAAKKQGIYILMDETYRFLEYASEDKLPSIAEIYNSGISVYALSRSFGLGGLRIGWTVSQDVELLNKMIFLKYYTSFCNAAPSEVLAIAALQAKELILKRNRQIILENLALLKQFIHKYHGLFSWIEPKGGCVAFVQLNHKKGVDQFCSDALEQAGIVLLPGTLWTQDSMNFRIGFGHKNFSEGLKALESFVKHWVRVD